jgi:hypothetical protein
MIEECGDRDPAGARVGALLQALLAREPAERRPIIRGWFPPGFMPPQVTIVSVQPPLEHIGIRLLDPLGDDARTIWRGCVVLARRCLARGRRELRVVRRCYRHESLQSADRTHGGQSLPRGY